jgi:hypothetical protein
MIAGSELLLCADRLRSLPIIDPFDRELVISCGAALFNLRVVFSHFRIPVEISTFPQPSDPDVLARLTFPRSSLVLADVGQLFQAIPDRVTNRQSFAEEALPEALIEDMRSAATMEGTEINMVPSSAQRERIASLVTEADLHQFKDPHFRRELANWIHPSRAFDGMPAYS